MLDGSARGWLEAIEEAGLCVAKDQNGDTMEKLEPFLNEPVTVWKNDSFIAAFPSPKLHITYGIDFPQVEEERYIFSFASFLSVQFIINIFSNSQSPYFGSSIGSYLILLSTNPSLLALPIAIVSG